MTNEESRLFEITIEIPRWGFIKRGGNDAVDFISPLPCPYNYGAISEYLGVDGDLLDAVVLGRRLARGTTIKMRVYGAIGLTDHGDYDDKLICSDKPLSVTERFFVLNFFRLYAMFKQLLNFTRRRPGPTVCVGWRDVNGALARARPH